MRIEADGEHVVITIGQEMCVLTTREAFDATTALVVAIDQARGYAAAKRGEVPDPKPLPRRRYKR